MTKWQVKKLNQLVSFKTGKLDSNAAKPNGQYPFFTCSQQTLKTDTYSFDGEVVLLGGNNANGIYPLKYFYGKFDAYQRTYVIRSIDSLQLRNRYLYYSLHLQLDFLRSLSTGSATKFLTLTILNDFDLTLPPINVQDKIIDILSAYDDLIENNTRRIKILEEMAQMLYREWFINFRFPNHENVKMVESDLGLIPEGWEVVELSKLIDVKHGYAFKGEYFSKEPTYDILLTPTNFAIGGGFKDDKFKYYLGEVPNDYILKSNDLLVTMTDLSKLGDALGYPALIPDSKTHRFLHNQRLGKIIIHNTKLIGKNLLYYSNPK